MTLQEYAKEIQAGKQLAGILTLPLAYADVVEDEAVAAMPFALTECSFG